MNIKKAKELCRSLPGATEDIKWTDHLVFSIGGKMFAVADVDEKSTSIRFKVDDDRFLELTDRPGIIPAPYLARVKWVQLSNPKALPLAELKALVSQSHALVLARLSKKLQREILGS